MTIDVSSIQAFHGHLCPGLAIGIRVAEKAVQEMGERPGDHDVIAIVETNHCAVDAIQFITGCTFGKGNLVHLDYGKNAFRFICPGDQKAIRVVVRPESLNSPAADEQERLKRWGRGLVTVEEKIQLQALFRRQVEMILSAPLEDLITVQEIPAIVPHSSRTFNSLACAGCGEMTMETRLHLLDGKVYCLECFEMTFQGRRS
jgi:formylmethanofuran dehydrogenase subunit E